ncbi:acyl-CoA-binding protein [Parasitella parasitica]|nr:acyl-CoA-binding protein [Parasitella parasitica]
MSETFETSKAFKEASEEVKNLAKKPTDDDLLKLYALFKQTTVGDINTNKPGIFDMKGRYKWDAWNELKGKSQEDAQTEYIGLVKKLQGDS